MQDEYDVIVLGTGLKECILSGLLSVKGKKVLQLDRNNFYGGDCASLNLTNLYKIYKNENPPAGYGANRDWNVDLIPKFVMGTGDLVKLLLCTGVTRYFEWNVVDGTYVYLYQPAGFFSDAKYIHRVPSNEREVISSPLMGLLEKNRCRKFFIYISNFDEKKPETWEGVDPQKTTMKEFYDKFGLQEGTIDFVGHCLACQLNDDYLQKPCVETVNKIKLYMMSMMNYGKSPFIYPIYGLGGLPEGFSRLCAIHGGVFMLNKPIEKVENGEDDFVYVHSSDGEVAKAKQVICDPSYLSEEQRQEKLNLVGEVIRVICILSQPIPDIDNCQSVQIIIPQKQLKRKSDIYVLMLSHTHQVCLEGKFLAIVSATIETDDPMNELAPAFKLLGHVEDHFVITKKLYEKKGDQKNDGIFVTNSYDATSHFETCAQDVLEMHEKITGEKIDLESLPTNLNEDE